MVKILFVLALIMMPFTAEAKRGVGVGTGALVGGVVGGVVGGAIGYAAGSANSKSPSPVGPIAPPSNFSTVTCAQPSYRPLSCYGEEFIIMSIGQFVRKSGYNKYHKIQQVISNDQIYNVIEVSN